MSAETSLADAISNLASPDDQLILTVRQLKAIIGPLEERLHELELRVDAHSRKICKKKDSEPAILDELYKEMGAQGRKQVDFATAARMVKRSKGRLLQLKGDIALDNRFVIVPSKSHGQKLLIRLREFYKAV